MATAVSSRGVAPFVVLLLVALSLASPQSLAPSSEEKVMLKPFDSTALSLVKTNTHFREVVLNTPSTLPAAAAAPVVLTVRPRNVTRGGALGISVRPPPARATFRRPAVF